MPVLNECQGRKEVSNLGNLVLAHSRLVAMLAKSPGRGSSLNRMHRFSLV